MLVALTIKFIPKDVLERNRKASVGMWKDGKPEKWYFAIPIIMIWVIVFVLLPDSVKLTIVLHPFLSAIMPAGT